MTVAPVLSAELRERTRAAHERAEGSPFVGALLTGRLPLAAYTALAAAHHAIYTALEARVESLAVHHPALTRAARLGADLEGLLGAGWAGRSRALRSPAVDVYVARLHAAGPVELLAHHYVRYLGDLSGGQVVRRAVLGVYGPATPVAFYDFTSLGPVKPFRDAYRARLDATPLDAAGRALLLDEAVLAFELNRAVFADLAAAHPG